MNDLEGVPLVMARQILDVFEEKGGRAVMLQQSDDFIKEVPLFLILKAVFSPQAVFL